MTRWISPGLLWLLVVLVTGASAPAAELSVSMPLGPYFRPGRYLPVRVAVALSGGADGHATLTGDGGTGAEPTRVEVVGGRFDAVVPWLVIDGRARRARLSAEGSGEAAVGPELRLLGETERLVGWATTPDDAFARELVRGAPKVIPVELDPVDPAPGTAAAWEMLDAVVLDDASAARLDESRLAGLLACGVTVAVRTAGRPPLPAWPWVRRGAYVVLRYDVAGPASGVEFAGAYAPVADWQAGWPVEVRRRVAVVGLGCCAAFVGLALWRPRGTAVWAVALGVALCAGIAWWWRAQPAVRQAGGEVVVVNAGGLTQTDAWTYQGALSAQTATLAWADMTWPIFASRPGADDPPVVLECDSAGRPRGFEMRLPANRRVAFVSRSVGLRAPRAAPVRPVTSPLAGLAEDLYGGAGTRVVGEFPGASGGREGETVRWPAVVIERDNDAKR